MKLIGSSENDYVSPETFDQALVLLRQEFPDLDWAIDDEVPFYVTEANRLSNLIIDEIEAGPHTAPDIIAGIIGNLAQHLADYIEG